MDKTDNKDAIEDDIRCRLFCCFRSKKADWLGNPKMFMVIYSILNALQGMLFTYYIGVMASFEEHFQLNSEALGAVLSIGELIPVFTALICSYFGGASDRPRWMSFCMFIIGLGCYISSLPYFIFGIPPRENNSVNHTATSENNSALSSLCIPNGIDPQNNQLTNFTGECKIATTQENNMYALGLYLLGYTIFNNGVIILYIIGTPYIDDNVQQKNSPIYLAITCSMRSAGPLVGFILSYACLTLYVDPIADIDFSHDDLHWIGAWWLGYLVMGTIALMGSFFVAQFPVRLPSRHLTSAMEMASAVSNEKKSEENETRDQTKFMEKIYSSIKELLPTVRRVLTNVQYLLRLGSGLFTWFGLEGIVLYLPKYLEHQFRVTQSEASIWAGATLIAPSIIGTLAIGCVIHRIRPTSRQLALAVIISKIVYSVTILSLMSVRCENAYVLGTQENTGFPSCDVNCNCTALPFTPVCGSDGKNYLSACHAGCSNAKTSNETWIYQDCSCIPDGTASDNLCSHNCSQFNLYVSVLLLCNFLLSVEVVGDLLFVLRCVLIRDKTMALAIFSAAFSLLVFIPNPLIFSSIVDSACSLWASACGEIGNCILYDLDRFRYLLHVVPFGLLVAGVILDILFWLKCKSIVLFGEEEETIQEVVPTIKTISS